ncbi:MAG: hypothetical protein ACRENP_13505 [Longimicrobiales bacterium]
MDDTLKALAAFGLLYTGTRMIVVSIVARKREQFSKRLAAAALAVGVTWVVASSLLLFTSSVSDVIIGASIVAAVGSVVMLRYMPQKREG